MSEERKREPGNKQRSTRLRHAKPNLSTNYK